MSKTQATPAQIEHYRRERLQFDSGVDAEWTNRVCDTAKAAHDIQDRLVHTEALLHRIDQRGYVGDRDHEDIQRLLSGAGPTRDNRRWFGRDGSKWEGE